MAAMMTASTEVGFAFVASGANIQVVLMGNDAFMFASIWKTKEPGVLARELRTGI